METCAFRKVAASIEKNFPEAEAYLITAREALENPARETVKGSDEDLQTLLGWVERGRSEGEAEDSVAH